jgi:hypothetical protein
VADIELPEGLTNPQAIATIDSNAHRLFYFNNYLDFLLVGDAYGADQTGNH